MNIKNTTLSLLLTATSLSIAIGEQNATTSILKQTLDKHQRGNAFRKLFFDLVNLSQPIQSSDIDALINQAEQENLLYGNTISFLRDKNGNIKADSLDPSLMQITLADYAQHMAKVKENEMRQSIYKLIALWQKNQLNLNTNNEVQFNKTMKTLFERLAMRDKLKLFNDKFSEVATNDALESVINEAKEQGILYGDAINYLLPYNFRQLNVETVKSIFKNYFNEKITQKENEIAQAVASFNQLLQEKQN